MKQKGVVGYPKDEEIFELTLDGDKHSPIEMVRRADNDPEKWGHKGTLLRGNHTRRFMLVTLGFIHGVDTAANQIREKYGEVPEGQWAAAFEEAYPDGTGESTVGVADPSWDSPTGPSFPCVGWFQWADCTVENWRWLVAIRE